MADNDVFKREINKWLKDMTFIHAGGDMNAEKTLLRGHITTTKGNHEGDFNGGEGSVDPGKNPKSNMGKNPLFAGLKDKNSNNKARQGKMDAMPEVIIDKS